MKYRISTNILSIMYNLIANLESPYTSCPRFQFSKHLHLFLLSYGPCHICATCATYGSSGRDTHRYMDMIKSFTLATFFRH